MPNPSVRSHLIPEDVQSSLRERLVILRKNRGLFAHQIPGISRGAMGKYETADISTMRIADLYLLSEAFGLSLNDLVTFLFGEADIIGDQSANTKRMMRLMSLLSDEDATLACEIIDKLVDAKPR